MMFTNRCMCLPVPKSLSPSLPPLSLTCVFLLHSQQHLLTSAMPHYVTWVKRGEDMTMMHMYSMYMYLPHWQSISSPDLLCQLDKLWWILLLNVSPRETKGQLMWAYFSRLYTSPGLLPLFLWQNHSLASLASSTLRNHSQPNHKRQIDTHTPKQ